MADFYTNELMRLDRERGAMEEQRRYENQQRLQEESANRQLLAQLAQRKEAAEKHRLGLAKELGTAAGMLNKEGPRFAEGQQMEQQVADVARQGARAQVANAREIARRKAQADMDRLTHQQQMIGARQTALEGKKQEGRLQLQEQKHMDNLERDAEQLKADLLQDAEGTLNDIFARKYDFYFDSLLAKQKHDYDQALAKLKASIEQQMTGLTPHQAKVLRLKLSAINAMGSQAKGMMSNALTGLLFRSDMKGFNESSKIATEQFFNANLALGELTRQLGMGKGMPTAPQGAQPQAGAPAQPPAGGQPAAGPGGGGTEAIINREDLSVEEKLQLLQGM